MQSPLESVLILLATAVLVVAVFRLLKLPPMLGYLMVGVAIGPHALGWIPDTEAARQLAEIGVVFLMFSIGLEFSLPKLFTMRRIVFGLGSAQVLLTLLAVWAMAAATGIEWRAALILGGVLALSSTAILAKLLAERLELNSAHGRQIMGILLAQDLAVVPLLILAPALAAGTEALAVNLGFALLKAAVVLTLLLYIGQRLMRSWFHLVARQKSAEFFVLNVLLITLGLAYVTELAGLSLALGAFLAGALISETEYRYQVEVDIRPFRDVLLGLFFVTIGMMLDLRVVYEQAPWVILVLAGLLAFKAVTIVGLSLAFGADLPVALRTGLALAACGEFGFVLLGQADRLALIGGPVMQPVLAAMLVSMMITPFIALDVDPQRIREATAAGESVVFGDAARREVLVAAGLMRAKVLAITYSDTASALRILGHVQELRPGLAVVVRTLDDTDIDRLKEAGAAEVVSEIMEGSLMLASTALMLLGVPLNRVLQRIRETREQRYSLFRGFFRGITDESDAAGEAKQPRLRSVTIAPGAAAVGRALGEIGLESLGVEVTAVRRRNIRGVSPEPDTRVKEGDVLVLRGTEQDLAAAEIRLMQG